MVVLSLWPMPRPRLARTCRPWTPRSNDWVATKRVFTHAFSWTRSRTVPTPSSTTEIAPSWIPTQRGHDGPRLERAGVERGGHCTADPQSTPRSALAGFVKTGILSRGAATV